jgi:hypothetical protein
MMSFLEVYLYYPNNWRKNIKDLASEDDKRFNWFLCATKYQDDRGRDVAKINKGSKFYDIKTGKNYILLKSDIKILILRSSEVFNTNLDPEFSGFASMDLGCENKDDSTICKDIIFHFLPEVLDETVRDSECYIISYAKRRNKCIRRVINTFPLPDEIDECLKMYNREAVCKILYEYINRYLNLV